MWFFQIFLTCIVLVGYALYLQHVAGLEPCPLCILQRFAFICIGLLALVAGIHNPKSWGRHIYAGLVFASADVGASVAGRHTWLQYNPDPFASCGADLAYTLENFPLSKSLPTIFRGTGSCGSVDWIFLGLSMPAWSMLFLIAIAILSLWILITNLRNS